MPSILLSHYFILIKLCYGTALQYIEFVDMPRYAPRPDRINLVDTCVVKNAIVPTAQN